MSNTIDRVRVLTGHTSSDTAYLVQDYPYGRVLRCQIRYWVETASKGAKKGQQRFVSQTTNPKVVGEPWNKPHPGQYSPMVFMYLNGDDHVKHFGVSESGITPESDASLRLMGIYDQMTPGQRAQYHALVEVSRRYAEPWRDWDNVITAMADHMRTTGDDPEPINGIWEWPAGRAYISEYDLPVYLTSARQRIAAAVQ